MAKQVEINTEFIAVAMGRCLKDNYSLSNQEPINVTGQCQACWKQEPDKEGAIAYARKDLSEARESDTCPRCTKSHDDCRRSPSRFKDKGK